MSADPAEMGEAESSQPPQPHLLHLVLGSDWVSLRVECPGVEIGGCQTYTKRTKDGCRCQDEGLVCDACSPTDPGMEAAHDECEHYSDIYVDVLGQTGCLLEPYGTSCGVLDADLTVSEMLHGPAEWNITTYPVPVLVGWDDGYPTLTPWEAS